MAARKTGAFTALEEPRFRLTDFLTGREAAVKQTSGELLCEGSYAHLFLSPVGHAYDGTLRIAPTSRIKDWFE